MIICFVLIAALLAAVTLLFRWELRSRGEISRKLEAAEQVQEALNSRLERLEQGVVPDYEEAKAAVKAVNDFNVGLAGIMGYDPMAAIKKTRQGEGEAE